MTSIGIAAMSPLAKSGVRFRTLANDDRSTKIRTRWMETG
jgi:hypothetical protein